MADTKGSSSGGFQVSTRSWVGVALAVLALVFIFQNRETVSINLLVFTIKAAQWVALLGIFIAGLVTGWLISRRRA